VPLSISKIDSDDEVISAVLLSYFGCLHLLHILFD